MSTRAEKNAQRSIIKEMYEAGRDIEEIANAVERSETTVRAELLAMGINDWKERDKLSSSEKFYKALTTADVARYRNRLHITEYVQVRIPTHYGDEVHKKTIKAQVKRVYPHVVLTDKGCFQTKDLALWNGLKF